MDNFCTCFAMQININSNFSFTLRLSNNLLLNILPQTLNKHKFSLIHKTATSIWVQWTIFLWSPTKCWFVDFPNQKVPKQTETKASSTPLLHLATNTWYRERDCIYKILKYKNYVKIMTRIRYIFPTTV